MNDELLESYDFDHSMVFGYYGGGNFGDELLLTVLIDRLHRAGFTDLSYAYTDRDMHRLLGHCSAATPVFGRGPILRRMLRSRSIVMGGGGHWGMDANRTVLLLCLVLFGMRFVLRKQVFLIGVGYYDSTNRTGRWAAWLAGKAATELHARDRESFANFSRVSRRTVLDRDIAYSIDTLALDERADEAAAIDAELGLTPGEAAVLVGIRRFRGDRGDAYLRALTALFGARPQTSFVAMIFEPRGVDPEGYERLLTWSRQFANVTAYDLHVDPLSLIAFLRSRSSDLCLIAPQYHAQLSAHLVGMRHFPLSYDNKVSQLLTDIGAEQIVDLRNVTVELLEAFVVSVPTAAGDHRA